VSASLTGDSAGLIEIAVAAVVVGLDNFAVAIALSSLGQYRHRFRVVVTFAIFGGAAPAVGALLGMQLSAVLAAWAEILAVLLLAAIGTASIRSGLRGGALERAARQASTGTGLLLLTASVSADNLAVGFGLGLHGARALPLAIACGVSVGLLTSLGFVVGNAARERWERWSLLAAGILLLALAVAIGFG
jgi:putative Mn2+ efflux pump MntP